MIDRFDGKYAFLSNFYPCPIVYAGIMFRSSEATYQAMKAADPAMRERFAGLSAKDSKHLGRSIEIRPDWEDVKFPIMRDIVHEKFLQFRGLAFLLADTGDEPLIEGNWWHDNTYGDCHCPQCAGTPGRNVLGNILMGERAYWQKTLGWPRRFQ